MSKMSKKNGTIFFSPTIKMYSLLSRHKELIPLLGFVISGVTVGTSMFVYKLSTNPNIRIDKKKRQQIIRDF